MQPSHVLHIFTVTPAVRVELFAAGAALALSHLYCMQEGKKKVFLHQLNQDISMKNYQMLCQCCYEWIVRIKQMPSYFMQNYGITSFSIWVKGTGFMLVCSVASGELKTVSFSSSSSTGSLHSLFLWQLPSGSCVFHPAQCTCTAVWFCMWGPLQFHLLIFPKRKKQEEKDCAQHKHLYISPWRGVS